MLEGKPTPAGSGRASTGYRYPGDLARFVWDRWGNAPEFPGGVEPLPNGASLEGFFSACYQASMLREERPVVCRAILAEPALFDPEGRPPEGLQRLDFPRSLPFDLRELRRLSVAADPQRTIIGVRQDGEGSLPLRRIGVTSSSASSSREGSRARGWTSSSRNGCRARSPGSWRSSRSGTRSPATTRANSPARGERRLSRRFRSGSRSA
jgi:hypothetical protein